MIDYFEGADEETPPATLERLIGLAEESKILENEILNDTMALSAKQDRLSQILMERIPDIMEELALTDFGMADGSKITVKKDVKASISEERKPAAFAWLRANDFDGIIKTNVSAAFGKGEAELAEKARDALTAAGFSATMADSVHYQTLKAFVKEQLEAGTKIPMETFGVFEFKIAKIDPPKAPKARK
jgi:hypothetical protein